MKLTIYYARDLQLKCVAAVSFVLKLDKLIKDFSFSLATIKYTIQRSLDKLHVLLLDGFVLLVINQKSINHP